MPIDEFELASFLSTIHLFHGLSEEQIAIVDAELKVESLAADVEVVKRGHRWIIFI